MPNLFLAASLTWYSESGCRPFMTKLFTAGSIFSVMKYTQALSPLWRYCK